jgi:arylsulfatase A-like enzyme
VPLFIRWPAEIQPDVDIDRLTRHVDLFPTLAELAGARIPDQLQLVGRSLLPLIHDPGETNNLIDAYPEVASDMLNAYDQWWHEVRELMINEDATLDTPKPFMVQFEQQKMEQGIPDWRPPYIGSLDSDVE